MATGHPEDEGPTDTSTEDDFVETEDEIESEKPTTRRGRLKQKVSNFIASDEESEDWGEQPVMGDSDLSRRGFLGAVGAGAVGLYGVAEATDGDGWAVDLSEGQQPAGGGVTPPPGNDTDGQTPSGAVGINNPEQYAFETEEELIEETGLCYPQESGVYIGAIDADEIEETLSESGYSGEDPTGALNVEEVEMGLDDITEHQGMYAVDVDRKQGNDSDYDLFVQLVGQEDGGTYLTREGAVEVSEMEFEETFEGYQDCN